MVAFTLELAGIPVGVEALFESTREFCAGYLTDASPVVRIAMAEADLAAERVYAAKQDEREGRATRAWSPEYLELLALYRKAATALLAHDVVVFHGAVLGVDGRAYLFTAPSGTGKTTHARHWLSQVPGAYVLNGDKPLLRVGASDGGDAFGGDADAVVAYGTPWQGKERMGVRGSLPLAGICLLERGETDVIWRVDAREALPTLISQAYRPESPAALVRVVELVGALAEAIPLWRMRATSDESSARVSYAAMSADV